MELVEDVPSTGGVGSLEEKEGDLRFHKTLRGKNVRLLNDGKVADRVKGISDTIVYTNRSININEKIRVKVNAIDPTTAAGLGYGITTYNLGNWTKPLPKYWNEFETALEGQVWKKLLPSDQVSMDTVVELWVNPNGDLSLQVGNNPEEVVLTGIDTRVPLYAAFDLGWGVVELEMLS